MTHDDTCRTNDVTCSPELLGIENGEIILPFRYYSLLPTWNYFTYYEVAIERLIVFFYIPNIPNDWSGT